MAKKEGLGFTFKSLCLKMKARVSGGGICVRLRNKLSLLAGSSILIIAPCLAKPAVAADDDHALTNIVDEGMKDGYQSAGSSSSAGTSYAGIGYGDQLLTDPITLYKVPNFDFGYHKKTESNDSFPLINTGTEDRVLIVEDKNGHLNWNVTASLGKNNVSNSKIESNDVSISFSAESKVGAFLKKAPSKNAAPFDYIGENFISGISMFENQTTINGEGTPKVILQRTLNNTDSNNKNNKDSLAVMITFVRPNSAQLNLDLDKQPYTADKYVAPITWTLNVTN